MKIIKEIDGGSDALLHYVMQNLNPKQRMKSDDFVMLVSRRPSRDRRYILCTVLRATSQLAKFTVKTRI